MQFNEALSIYSNKLGTHSIMALAASQENHVTVRNVSCIHLNGKIYFKTDKNFHKTKQLLANHNVALCCGGIAVEGTAKNLGLVAEQPISQFQTLYKQFWEHSYNAYPHESTEILFEITPFFAEIWNQDESNHAFQILIDFVSKIVEKKQYD